MQLIQYVEPPPPQISGFDAGFLDGLAAGIDLAALADATSFVDDLGDLAAHAQKMADKALTAIDDIKDLVEGAVALEPLVNAASHLVSLGGWSD